jgi:hypothetical protein
MDRTPGGPGGLVGRRRDEGGGGVREGRGMEGGGERGMKKIWKGGCV